MINTRMIKDRMKALGITQGDLAKALDIAQPTVCQKLNNVRPMCLQEAETIAKLLKISDSAFSGYFFCSSCRSQVVRVKVKLRYKRSSGQRGRRKNNA